MLDECVPNRNTNIPESEHGPWISQAVNFYLLMFRVSGKSGLAFGSLGTEPFQCFVFRLNPNLDWAYSLTRTYLHFWEI